MLSAEYLIRKTTATPEASLDVFSSTEKSESGLWSTKRVAHLHGTERPLGQVTASGLIIPQMLQVERPVDPDFGEMEMISEEEMLARLIRFFGSYMPLHAPEVPDLELQSVITAKFQETLSDVTLQTSATGFKINCGDIYTLQPHPQVLPLASDGFGTYL